MQAKRELFDKEDTYSLRGLCMLAIIGHHLYQWTESRYGVGCPLPIELVFSNAGYLGSAIFFLISGYGTSLSLWKNKQTTVGTINRLLKLYLPFVFYWVIGSIMLLTEGNGLKTIGFLGLITLDLPVSGGVNGLLLV